MTRILQINSSIFADDGESSRLADAYVEQLRRRDPATEVRRRDLARDPIPHLSADAFQAALTPADERTAEQAELAAGADALIEELEWADLLVLGVPMYNFTIPSGLKAWFDRVARAGRTFRYTPDGPEGLLPAGKAARVFQTSGGIYAPEEEFVTPLVQRFLHFLGIEDVRFVPAQGLMMGEDARTRALADAEEAIRQQAA